MSPQLGHDITAQDAADLEGEPRLFLKQFVEALLRPGQHPARLSGHHIGSRLFTTDKAHLTNELPGLEPGNHATGCPYLKGSLPKHLHVVHHGVTVHDRAARINLSPLAQFDEPAELTRGQLGKDLLVKLPLRASQLPRSPLP